MSSVAVEEQPVQEQSDDARRVSVDRPRALRMVRESPRRVKVNTALRFYHEVVGLEHLHYGLWDGEPLSLEGLKTAQDRFSRELCSWIPRDQVRTVLDVGCGVGSTTLMLKEAGFQVEGLSPDPYHEEAFSRRVGTRFHLKRFQEFEPPRTYDLVLMSESAQYIWLNSLFPSVVRAAPGGYLLVADYFTVNGCQGVLGKSGHNLKAFLDEAAAAGLVLERQEDITERVTPTLDLARSWIERYIDPCISIAGDYVLRKVPRLARVVRWMFKDRIARLSEMRTLVDSEEFRLNKRYSIFLFRIPS